MTSTSRVFVMPTGRSADYHLLDESVCRAIPDLSLVAGTPTFPVALWPKVRKLFSPLGLEGRLIPFPVFAVEAMAERIVQDLAAGEAVRTELRKLAEDQRHKLREFEELLRTMAGGRGIRAR